MIAGPATQETNLQIRSPEKDALFVWIPKNAGSSVFRALSEAGCAKLKDIRTYDTFENRGLVTFAHVSVSHLLARNVISQEYFQRAFKFCFVRNPWDRLVSVYHYRKYHKRIDFEGFVRLLDRKFRVRETLRGRWLQQLYGSNRFCRLGGPKRISRIVNSQLPLWARGLLPLPAVGPYSVLELSQANPQADWIYDDQGHCLVDFIGRMETLSEDVAAVFARLGIDASIPHLNKSTRKKYHAYYTAETREIVSRLYQRDIELFDYSY